MSPVPDHHQLPAHPRPVPGPAVVDEAGAEHGRVVNAEEEAGVKAFWGCSCWGRQNLFRNSSRLLNSVEVDELMVTVDLHDPVKRRHALDILAALEQFQAV